VVSLSNHERANRILRRNHAKTAHTAFPTQRPAGGRSSHFLQTIDNELFHAVTTTHRSLAPKSHTANPRRGSRPATHPTAPRARLAAHHRRAIRARRAADGRDWKAARRMAKNRPKKRRRALTRAKKKPFHPTHSRRGISRARRARKKPRPAQNRCPSHDQGSRVTLRFFARDNTTRNPTGRSQLTG